MRVMIVVLSLFFGFTGLVSAQDGECADTDNNEYIVLAQQFERFLLERCAVEKEGAESVQYACADGTSSLPAGFHAVVVKDVKYWKIFVSDSGKVSSFLTVLEAPLILVAETPVRFYAPEEEVLEKMREVVALLPGDDEVKPQVAYDLDL